MSTTRILSNLVVLFAFVAGVATWWRVTDEKPIGWRGRVWGIFEGASPPEELRALVERDGKLELIAAPLGSDRLRLPGGATVGLTPRAVTLDATTVRASRTERGGEPVTRLVITSDGSVQKSTYALRGDEIVFLSAMGHGMLGPLVAIVDGGIVFAAVLGLGLFLVPKNRRARPAPTRG